MASETIEIHACTGPTYHDNRLILGESFLEEPEGSSVISLKHDYIAGIYLLIDCYLKERVPFSPILLRLENHDYVLRINREGRLLAWEGALPDQIPVCDNADDISTDACYWIWSTDYLSKNLIGCTLDAVSELSQPAQGFLIRSDNDQTRAYFVN